MTVVLWLLGGSLFLGGLSLAVFLWSLRNGQYEDLEGAANRILFEPDGPEAGVVTLPPPRRPAGPPQSPRVATPE